MNGGFKGKGLERGSVPGVESCLNFNEVSKPYV